MRILGTLDHDEEIPPHEPPVPDEISPPFKKSSQAKKNRNYEHKNYEHHNDLSQAQKNKMSRSESNSVNTMDSEEGGCLPLWITDAPTWLKLVIVLSTALLVGAIVLIGVGAALAVQEEKLAEKQINDAPFSAPFNAPVAAPITSPDDSPVMSPNDPPSGTPDNPPAASPVSGPVSAPTNEADDPTPAPVATNQPPLAPGSTAAPTRSATPAPTGTTVSFFVTGGRFTGDSLAALPEQLQSLPNLDGNSVMFHLGDWNSPFATSCVESSYQTNVALYNQSAIPVYFVPGDNEFNGT
jgi:hypothetical protein